MAIVEVKVPQLSESVAEATLLQWKKKPGDAVAIDEILIEIETDKVVLEVPAPAAGVIVAIVQGDGATVAADQVIAQIDTEAKAGAAAPAAAAPAPAATTAAPVVVTAVAAVTGGSKSDVAMPAAAKLMADNSLAAGFRGRYRQGWPHHQGRCAGRPWPQGRPSPRHPWPRRPLLRLAPCLRSTPRRCKAWVIALSNGSRCRACGPAWPSVCCSRSR